MSGYPFLLHTSYLIIFSQKHEVDNKKMLVRQPVFITCSLASSHCFEVLVFQSSKNFVVLSGKGLVWDLSLPISLSLIFFLICTSFLQIRFSLRELIHYKSYGILMEFFILRDILKTKQSVFSCVKKTRRMEFVIIVVWESLCVWGWSLPHYLFP